MVKSPAHRVEVRVVGVGELERCHALRRVVFQRGQGVPRSIDEDGRDSQCVLFLAALGGADVGTARLREVPGHGAKAERVAVLAEARGHGVGRELMRALERVAAERGHGAVHLNAQADAIPFYERIGYVAHGPAFTEADIEHRAMSLEL